MPPSKKEPLSPSTTTTASATIRQQRRRQRLKEQNTQLIQVLLTSEQGDRLSTLLETGYAPNQSAVMSKALDEAYERETTAVSRAEKVPCS